MSGGEKSSGTESASFWETVFHSAPEPICLLDGSGTIRSANAAFEALFELEESPMDGLPLANLIHPNHRRMYFELLKEVLREGEVRDREFRILCRRGTPVFAAISGKKLENHSAEAGLLFFFHEISRFKGQEWETLEAIQKEQQRIGQDLHETVGQELMSLSYLATGIAKQLEEERNSEAEKMAVLAESLRQVLSRLRKSVQGMMPAEVDAGSFRTALERLAVRTQTRYELSVQLDCDEVPAGFDADVLTNLYRIAQEAVQNAVRHAKAANIRIKADCEPDHLILRVWNDGVPFDETNPEDASGIGFRIMQYRAELIGAALEIQSDPAEGTWLTCRVPTPPE